MNNSITYTNTDSNKCNVKFVSKCYYCAHNEVCGYRDEYNKLLEDVEKTVNCKSYNKMFSLSVDCKHFKDNNLNMINYKGYTISCIDNKPMLDPSKITVTTATCEDAKIALKDEGKICIANTGVGITTNNTDKNKLKVAREGFQNYYTDEDFFS